MKNLLLKNLSISLHGLVIFELLSVYPNKIFAKDIEKNKLKEISINYEHLEQNKVNNFSEILSSTYKYKYKLVNDLKANGHKLFSLLAFEKINYKHSCRRK